MIILGFLENYKLYINIKLIQNLYKYLLTSTLYIIFVFLYRVYHKRSGFKKYHTTCTSHCTFYIYKKCIYMEERLDNVQRRYVKWILGLDITIPNYILSEELTKKSSKIQRESARIKEGISKGMYKGKREKRRKWPGREKSKKEKEGTRRGENERDADNKRRKDDNRSDHRGKKKERSRREGEKDKRVQLQQILRKDSRRKTS